MFDPIKHSLDELNNNGISNSGHYNTGNWNSGNSNSGNHNTGNYNSSNHNTGNYNSGNHNSGDHNNGSYNSGSYNSGCFNKQKHEVYFMDRPVSVYLNNSLMKLYQNEQFEDFFQLLWNTLGITKQMFEEYTKEISE